VDLKLTLAILIGKLVSSINKIKGTGATAAPGLYALKIDPNLVSKITQKNKLQSIIVSGTNGKTTTSRLISEILSTKFKLIHNRQGSNLLRGVASTLISQSSLAGDINADLCLWEADEASLTSIAENTNPKAVVLLNLFRDQLDRYGEIDTTRKKWQTVLGSLNKDCTLISNADDPNINFISKATKAKKVFFGIGTQKINLPDIENIADVKFCPNCSKKLEYLKLYSAHLGTYKCTNCSFKRKKPAISAQTLNFKSDFSTELVLEVNGQSLNIHYPLPGLFNVYNVLAAATVANTLGLDPKNTKTSIEEFSAAFGRFQKVKIAGKQVLIFLIKNPAGANEVLRTIKTQNNLNLLVILNDNIADGRDVSWIWDTNWEALNKQIANIDVSGTRALDLALRLKYAGFKIDQNYVHEDLNSSIDQALSKLDKNDTLYILPTYTALICLQDYLKSKGVASWQNQ